MRLKMPIFMGYFLGFFKAEKLLKIYVKNTAVLRILMV